MFWQARKEVEWASDAVTVCEVDPGNFLHRLQEGYNAAVVTLAHDDRLFIWPLAT